MILSVYIIQRNWIKPLNIYLYINSASIEIDKKKQGFKIKEKKKIRRNREIEDFDKLKI